MKKYITIAALLAAGSAFANAAAGDVVVLDSKLSYSDSNVSAWTEIQGIDADTTHLDIDQLAWKGTDTVTFTISASDMIKSNVTLGKGEYFSINTISLASRYTGQDKANYPATLTFSYNDVDYSGVAIYDYANAGKVGAINFNLDKALTTTTLALEDIAVTISFSATDENQFGLAVAKDKDSTLSGATSIWSGGWKPVVRISGVVIPEPSAFGLLAGLGALALVGTRRRRK